MLRDALDGREPSLLIGIVLPEDRCVRLTVSIDAAPWQISGAATSKTIGGTIEFLLDGPAIVARNGETRIGQATSWRLSSPEIGHSRPESRAVVHGVVAGRAFHWRGSSDAALSDVLTISVHDGQLMMVNELSLERYLVGVITSEMSGECPSALLESHAVVARSWTLATDKRKHAALGIDFCNDDCCQRYQGYEAATASAYQAVAETRGTVLMHESGTVVEANYSKCCGGIVEAPQFVWGRETPGQFSVVDGPPGGLTAGFYGKLDQRIQEFVAGSWLANCDAFCGPNLLPEVELPNYLGRVDDGRSHFRWSVDYSRLQLERILRAKVFEREGATNEMLPPLDTLLDLVPLERGLSGRITSLAIDYRSDAGTRHRKVILDQYWIRHALSDSFLYSSAFAHQIERDAIGIPTHIRLVGAGWGHGAGFCQTGGLGMALSGSDAPTILRHYFEHSELRRIYV